jgi:hypothetical protein
VYKDSTMSSQIAKAMKLVSTSTKKSMRSPMINQDSKFTSFLRTTSWSMRRMGR